MATDRSYMAENQTQLTRLRTLVDRLGDRELSRPLEAGWTVAGVLAHLAFWDYRVVTLLDAWGADGRGTPPPAYEEAAVNWINDAGKPLCLALPPRTAARLAVEAAVAA
ncbi:MAG: maleylpyruvate isomerase N-terminal domain-containing protein, partial [Candidatus Rokuibacteriota bacterium]